MKIQSHVSVQPVFRYGLYCIPVYRLLYPGLQFNRFGNLTFRFQVNEIHFASVCPVHIIQPVTKQVHEHCIRLDNDLFPAAVNPHDADGIFLVFHPQIIYPVLIYGGHVGVNRIDPCHLSALPGHTVEKMLPGVQCKINSVLINTGSHNGLVHKNSLFHAVQR